MGAQNRFDGAGPRHATQGPGAEATRAAVLPEVRGDAGERPEVPPLRTPAPAHRDQGAVQGRAYRTVEAKAAREATERSAEGLAENSCNVRLSWAAVFGCGGDLQKQVWGLA